MPTDHYPLPHLTAALLLAGLTTLSLLTACDINDRENRVDTRAIQAPTEGHGALAEMRNGDDAVPIVEGTIPDRPGQPVHVRTALDNLTDGTGSNVGGTQPPSGGTTVTPPAAATPGVNVDIRELPQSDAVPPATRP
jgi:hypothetical protein